MANVDFMRIYNNYFSYLHKIINLLEKSFK